jgi:RND family efflux transporter MFP subunit
MSTPQSESTKIRKGIRPLVITAIILLGLFLIGFLSRQSQIKRNNHDAQNHVLPQVTLLVAKPEDQPVQFLLPSMTQANHTTPVWARADGYIKNLLVDIGDVVKEGQPLVELDTPEIDQKYLQALHDLESAIAKRDVAKLFAERGKSILKFDPQAISKEDYEQRIANLIAAEADVKSFEANRNYYWDLMEFKHVLAPFDGIIVERNVDLGSLITAGSSGNPQQLFVIAASDIIRIFVNVPQSFFRLIREGMEGTTTIREFGEKKFPSIVRRYAKSLDQTAHNMLTELHIDNSSGELFPGLYAEVTFSFKPDMPYFIIPTTALIIRQSDPKVAVVDDQDIVHIRTVAIGLDYGKSVQIVSGINPGDKIVSNPTEKIREGVKVVHNPI